MERLRFYHIKEDYISFLHTVDRRVQFNKGQRRPYVGVVLKIGGFDYYVPLESPKPNHANIRSGGPVLKLDDGRLGIMGFNNMIPVERRHLIEFDIAKEPDEKYRNLLYDQLAFCWKNADLIYARAKATYRKGLEGKIPLYRRVCCDFRKLEESVKLYKPSRRRFK